MWIVRLALRRPYTFVVMAILILIMGTLAIFRTPTDIFPNINIPVVSIIWNFNGLVPQDMSDRIVSVTERALQRAGVRFQPAMELDHTEAIKQAVMAGLGVAFISIYAVRDEIATRRLHALRLRGVRVQRHFHVIHHEARRITASARAFMDVLARAAGRRARPKGATRKGD